MAYLICSVLEIALRQAPSFVSVMEANNETGVLLTSASIARLCRQYGAVLHVDAVQAVGKVSVGVRELECDYSSLSAHKFHGPKGIGILYAQRPAFVQSFLSGHQEANRRGGTENVPALSAWRQLWHELANWQNIVASIAALRDKFERSIVSAIPGAVSTAILKSASPAFQHFIAPYQCCGFCNAT